MGGSHMKMNRREALRAAAAMTAACAVSDAAPLDLVVDGYSKRRICTSLKNL
jgi:hypothetical protein